MNQKPSERIKEIADEMCRQADNNFLVDMNIAEKAIMQYLNEQYEKQQIAKLAIIKQIYKIMSYVEDENIELEFQVDKIKQEQKQQEEVCIDCGFSGEMDERGICWSSVCLGKKDL